MSRLLREIEEELKEEAWYAWLKEQGPRLLVALTVLVFVTAGYMYMTYRGRVRREGQSERYERALFLAKEGQREEARPLLQALVDELGLKGYGLLAHLCLVGCDRLKAKVTHDPEAIQSWQGHAQEMTTKLEQQEERVWSSFLKLASAYTKLSFGPVTTDTVFRSFVTPSNPWAALGIEGQLVHDFWHKEETAPGVMGGVLKELNQQRLATSGLRQRVTFMFIAQGLSMPEERTSTSHAAPAVS